MAREKCKWRHFGSKAASEEYEIELPRTFRMPPKRSRLEARHQREWVESEMEIYRKSECSDWWWLSQRWLYKNQTENSSYGKHESKSQPDQPNSFGTTGKEIRKILIMITRSYLMYAKGMTTRQIRNTEISTARGLRRSRICVTMKTGRNFLPMSFSSGAFCRCNPLISMDNGDP